MRRLLTIALVLMLTSSLAVSPQAVATEGNDCTCEDTEVVWGIQRGVDVPFLYSIDLSENTATLIADTETNDNLNSFPNGVAYDSTDNRLYFAEFVLRPGLDSRLHFYDFAGNQIVAGDLTGVVTGAAIHDGVYYYIPQGTGDLWAATLLPDGTIGTNILVKSDVSGTGDGHLFGDMAISADGSAMYISARTGGVTQLFRIDLSGNNYDVIDTDGFLLQLAFGLGGVLYGHRALTGMFYSVDTATGDVTEIGTVTGSETGVFTDLASFQPQSCDCEVQCPIATLDFEGHDAGTVIDDQYAPALTVTTNDPVNHPAMIFDSASPTGNDDDLGTPNEDFGGPGIGSGGALGTPGENSQAQNKVLIISQDGSTSNPDDYNRGGTITLTFDSPRPVYAVEILDIDADETGSVTANLEEGGQIVSNFDNLGNNSYQMVVVDAQGVSSLDVTFSSSGALATVIFCPREPECEDTEVVWGIQRGVDVPFLYSIDLSENTATLIADTETNDNLNSFPNGVAYDSTDNRLYFAEFVLRPGLDSRLHFYDFAGNQIVAGDLTGVVTGAAIHDGVYYYIPQGTGDLWAATLLPDGTIGTNILVKSDVSGTGDGHLFGDMAISADGSAMYISARTGGVTQLFRIDLSGNNYDVIDTDGFLLQLAFGLGGVLYGHRALTGMFYSVDTATGDVTEIGTVTGSETGVFTDLASFQTCILDA